jgi:hypothetical protein
LGFWNISDISGIAMVVMWKFVSVHSLNDA